MSGVAIVSALLRGFAPLIELVRPADIKGGALPDDHQLPAILVRSVSVVERQPLKRLGSVRVTERVAVAVRATNYRDQRLVIRLVRQCCSGRTGAIAGAAQVTVLPAGTGPDGRGPADTFEQTQDFRVGFDELV